MSHIPMRGRIVRAGLSLEGRAEVLLQVDDRNILNTDLINGTDLEVQLKKYRKRRSLNANNYAWALMTKIAEASSGRKDEKEIYHIMLMRYGVREIMNDSAVTLSMYSEIDLKEVNEDLYIHSMPIGKGMVNDREFTHYYLLKGSSKYDTKEMHTFLEGVISEAKELGIETLTEAELERLNYSG